MFTVGFESRNDHRKLVTSVQTWCETASDQFKDKNLEEMENQINASPKRDDQRVVVHGTVKFVKGVKVDELKSRVNMLWH